MNVSQCASMYDHEQVLIGGFPKWDIKLSSMRSDPDAKIPDRNKTAWLTSS